ncbi:MAG TPA: PEPxxWA-CTERM sorting domain-containing protein [Sphingomonas sp.]|uniref:PEPxxWA-CTERM sorting domain-containing protein n=1 Tax=Sphingomonas sp. TaxID=28214 RepID=UPI002CE99D81|nr:PEPxxWA-CTERM sorting domain-containing protein [Sphingomonas sp.]HMI20647.1 PEPxxWA-CTERM sorting domain-containing protein [Sphingomonas sp.]
MNKLLCACAAAALTIGAASGAAAQVVNFEDNPAQNPNQTVVSDGYAFSQDNCCQYSWAHGQNSDNGTTYLIYSEGPTVMTKIGGGTFDVSNLDAGLSFYADTNGFSLNLTGTRADSSTVTASLTLDFFFQTYTLSGFNNLVSLSFSNDPEGYIALDNINGSGGTSPAPEPASWALMLGGFGMVGGALRSRRKAAVSFG